MGKKSKYKNLKIKKFARLANSYGDTINEFNIAYNILEEECLYAEKKQGYAQLYKKIVPESKPPTNLGYLQYKIALDRYLSKATYKIYKLLNLT